jgi:transcriptional regulator with XRE-family HTH domain
MAKLSTNRARNLIGPRVREARITHKPEITQNDLSARLTLQSVYIGRAGISKIESGTREVTDFELVAIAKCLGVAPDWLLGIENSKSRSRG